jgi:peptide/nickel transport system permease protein
MRRLCLQLLHVAGIVLLAGIACAYLVRYSPGSLVDERELNHRLGEASLAALRAEKAASTDLGANLLSYLRGLIHGNLGYSESNNTPIAELIGDRAPVTIRELAVALGGAWILGLGLAIPIGRFREVPHQTIYDAASSTTAGLLLSLPAALIAYLCLVAGAGAGVALIIVIAPRIFRFSRNLLLQAYSASHVEIARARGIPEITILWSHVRPSAAPQMLALFATSISMAIGAAIPVEAICDAPGLGRLAWQAASARDLPLLVNLTMLVAIATTTAMTIAGAMTPQETGLAG